MNMTEEKDLRALLSDIEGAVQFAENMFSAMCSNPEDYTADRAKARDIMRACLQDVYRVQTLIEEERG